MDRTAKNIIKEIAGELDCGLDCYYNIKTDELISIPNKDALLDFEDFEALFGESLKKVNTNEKDFIKIEVLKSFESYTIMETFVDEIADDHLRQKLIGSLRNKKPFYNFNRLIDYSDYRQKWFDFKQQALEKYVRKHLELG
ncbi:MAG TPA: hypothetical protein ENH91_14395 [Leeuwenhoekiella sp.]|nr:hypothetical protein [Leeuwenhoekiella sp.]